MGWIRGIWQGDLASRHTKPFLEHLEDLRRTMLWCAGFLAVGMALAIPLAPRILELLKAPVARNGLDPAEFLRVLRVAGGFSIALRVVFWSGLLGASPFIVCAIGHFVFPGLTVRERKSVLGAAGFAVLLFAGGVLMGYLVTLPVALRVMLAINRWMHVTCEFVELSDYVAFALKLLMAFGLAFELPVVLLALGGLGILSSDQLRRKRRHVIVGLMVLAMLLTPPDPLTQLLMAVPMALLYEACIWLIWLREKSRKTSGIQGAEG